MTIISSKPNPKDGSKWTQKGIPAKKEKGGTKTKKEGFS